MNEKIEKDINDLKKVVFMMYEDISRYLKKTTDSSLFGNELIQEINKFSSSIHPTQKEDEKSSQSLNDENEFLIDYKYIDSKDKSLCVLRENLEQYNKDMAKFRQKDNALSFIHFCGEAIRSIEAILRELFKREYICISERKSDNKLLTAYDLVCEEYRKLQFETPVDIYVRAESITSDMYAEISDGRYIFKKEFDKLKNQTHAMISIFFYILDRNFKNKKNVLFANYMHIINIKKYRNISSHGSEEKVGEAIKEKLKNQKYAYALYSPKPQYEEITKVIDWFIKEVYQRICRIS
ncbi:hypothetical protein V0288_18815 [Pannus brasiliensis CCIBt3594]|uniref:Uncharacterized protein n=1 Tax=Pannus brasiliensis CCIBt3594 TaxID=1427578 RepID=A0AAW9QN18_9CHRO